MHANSILKRYLVIVLFTTGFAASSTIKGKITDIRSGEPLIGANIMLSGTMLGSATNENGDYLISNVPIGSFSIMAMFIGYETMEEKILVAADQIYTIDLALKASSIELQETKVTAEKRKEKVTTAPASMEIITSRDIKGKNTTNMGAYLKGLKGIDFTSSGINNYSISVRGFNSSFNTRLLTLSDGRVANIPALRVINYSTIPQSMDDVDKIEVVLGPATALYGANAHSGVVNIISKPPSRSEGFTMSLSGSNDERQFRKINGRFAKKLSNSLSIKISGLYLHAYDWPFISEEEYKSHLYPWSLTPGRTADGKDNNPWNVEGTEEQLIWDWAVRDFDGDGNYTDSVYILIGNGEAMDTGDPDNDGVMGEDWYNGYDDDGDGLIDEDYFTANQIDDNNNSDDFADVGIDGIEAFDFNNDGDYDDICDGNNCDIPPDYGEGNNFPDPNEPGVNSDGVIFADGIDNDKDGLTDENIDENIDGIYDLGFDGVDNDNNGIVDDEAGDAVIDSNVKAWGNNIENNILIEFGRKDSLINGEINPYYIPNLSWEGNGMHLFGNHRYNEEKVILEFDIFTYDFGEDGLPGDPYVDESGDGEYQRGESLSLHWLLPSIGLTFDEYLSDCGLDGICEYTVRPSDRNDDGDFDDWYDINGEIIYETSGELNPLWEGPDEDGTEGDGIWQPGDGWLDINGNGHVDIPVSGIGDSWQEPIPGENDAWPPQNGLWDEGELIEFDYGQDGIANTGDPGEGDGIFIAWDSGENDGVFDTGDGLYAFTGEPFSDENQNGIKDPEETYTDTNNDGLYNAPDLLDNFQVVLDANGDGMDDYPDFEIDNRKVEFRIDYDPNPDFNMTLQTGYSWSKTQQVTGTGRYLADGFEYKFYQLRSRYKNWFSQFYTNEGFSGNTRGYNLGNRIIDKSKNYAFQIQNNFDIKSINTKFVWGMDYFRTDPHTNGTIINDGPNGYDNDGDNVIIGWDELDNDGDSDDYKDLNNNNNPDPNEPGVNSDGVIFSDGIDNDEDGEIDELIDESICPDGKTTGFRNGKYWKCGEGIDEPDEYIDPQSNEYGIYYQTSTELFGTSRYELITAARLDYHDLLDEGLLFAPKIGFIYKPDSKSSMRLTYGKAYNTPNSISLFTDLFVGKQNVFSIYLRGNHDGTEYCRVGLPCLGEDYPTSVATPGFYGEDNNTFYTFGPSDNITYFENYPERVAGAPYYFQFNGNDLISGDNIPLDTLKNVIFVPELNGDGVLYTAEESMNIPDVDPIKTEKIQTIEFGYKGFIGNRTHFSLDYYLSYYEDFFSPPTIITPLIVNREIDENGNDITDIDNLDVQGIMTINDAATYPPYATAFNGIDDNGDWAEYADEFGWNQNDKNGDGNLADPGEWGFVVYDYGDETYDGVPDDTTFFHPWEVMQNEDGFPKYQTSGAGSYIYNRNGLGYITVGVDEWTEFGALREIEIVEGANSIDGDDLPIGVTSAPYHLVLSPMNYGEVWMQGLDFGLTHFLTEKIIIDGNVSWYGTTDFYNELTKKKDPINAPKWKWNASVKGKTSLGDFILTLRHVDRFIWSDGIWSGVIGPYNIIDLFYTYHITNNLDFNLSALNLNNDLHKELIGGAIMGRQLVLRFTSTF